MNLNEWLDFLKEAWQFILLITGGIGGLFAWFRERKKDRELSHNVLFRELESLKVKMIALISNSVEKQSEISKRDMLINEMKAACPDCYDKAEKKLNYNYVKDN